MKKILSISILNNVNTLKSNEVAKGRPIILLITARKSRQNLKRISLMLSVIC